ncbi:NADH dehydrogenase I subunit 4, Involved in photosystem-1 cyclic electron flow [Richelia intracellularis HH01]|uniref:NADH dehydrogenase I subunit 4, Involved in photosystem-1 cyclic electron flow n=2 Tax=Richelia TaxID=98443 RepID=M1WZV2_9NOST|nr:NADH dehydrogenase I subunit 4, Involved in photosystem-1 cyclic electron flow [Richelia intracellularis HH01]
MCHVFSKNYDVSSSTFQLVEKYTWVPQLGFNWTIAVDGISVPLVLLTGLVTTLSIFSAWQVNLKPRLFYFLMLLLYSAQIGVFVARDLLLFFMMWELELVPVYLLISIWGGKKRRYAATKFLLYTAGASIFILLAALGMAFYGDNVTFDIADLALKNYPLNFELLLYVGLMIAFGVKLAIFPLHTWLPDAHGEASAPVSMILAGILLKMGAYGLIRLNLMTLGNAHVYFAPVLAVLGVVNIIYGALNSFAQPNMKRCLAYSSVSHMGFVLLGIASYSELGISGAMLQMISHGLIAAVLFFLAGVTYDRTHTLLMDKMGGIGQVMPKVFALFTVSAMASLAIPGMSGFASELTVFLGLTSSDIYSSVFCIMMVFLAAVGVILTPIYLLNLLRQVFYGTGADNNCEIDNIYWENLDDEGAVCFGTDCLLPNESKYRDASNREVFIAACLLVPIIAIGVYPKIVTQIYDVKTVAVNNQIHQSYIQIAETSPNIDAEVLYAQQMLDSEVNSVLGEIKQN